MAAIMKQALALFMLITLLGVLVSACSVIKIPYLKKNHRREMRMKCIDCCTDLKLVWSYNLITRKCSCSSPYKYYPKPKKEQFLGKNTNFYIAASRK